MPRSRSSGALSISSNGVNSARPLAAWRLVIAAVSVVLPWSMCPIVPMLTCGLVRSNFFLPISPLLLLRSCGLVAPNPGHDLLGDVGRHLVVGLQLHRRVRRAPLGARPQVGRIPEQLGEWDQQADRLLTAAVVDALDPPAARGRVAHDLAHELLGRDDLELHHRLEQDGIGAARGILQRDRAGDLERHLGRVDLVVGPVAEARAYVDQRLPGAHAGLHGLLDALVDRGDELARDLAADDLVDELVPAALAGGLEVDVDVAELPVTPALADEPALDLGHGP